MWLTSTSRFGVIIASLDHNHTPRMTFEKVVDKWDDHDDTSWWGVESESGQAFDEGGNECRR